MKRKSYRGSTKIYMNFKDKTHGASGTNKSFTHCNLECDLKIKHMVCPRPKNLTTMKEKFH